MNMREEEEKEEEVCGEGEGGVGLNGARDGETLTWFSVEAASGPRTSLSSSWGDACSRRKRKK